MRILDSMKPFTIIALLMLTITSCQYDPYAGDMTTLQPKFENVLGTYKFEKQTIGADSINKLAKSATITLYADSTYKATNIPSFTYEHYESLISVAYSGECLPPFRYESLPLIPGETLPVATGLQHFRGV
jgi:hypothetical protein